MKYFKLKKIEPQLNSNLLEYLNNSQFTNQHRNIEKLITCLHTILRVTDKKISKIVIPNSIPNRKIIEYINKHHKIQTFDSELLSYLTRNGLENKLNISDFYNMLVSLYIESIRYDLAKLLKFLENERLTLKEQQSVISYITNNFTFDRIKQECDNNTNLNKQKLAIILHTIQDKQISTNKEFINGLITVMGGVFIVVIITYLALATWTQKFNESSIGQVIVINSLVTIIPTVTIYLKSILDFDSPNTTETATIQLAYLKDIIINSQTNN
ncbi:TPA: hypothetical protein U1X30_002217 [Streptococcus suis]|nr:hypothetical protein A7J10_12800 [Streptococcus suis]KPA63848.1 hypothetical protein XK27_10960 [Streptococcus suis]HEM4267047.1 hypothetical protein [Streptococcus suis]HEM4951921.1 hypothetical protein [Streptococcus suis]HEM5092365.1 hypothetical protein [Streptococcus suis]